MLHFSENKMIDFYNTSSQQLNSNSKPRSPYVRVVPALLMEKLKHKQGVQLKHKQGVLSKVQKEATSGLMN